MLMWTPECRRVLEETTEQCSVMVHLLRNKRERKKCVVDWEEKEERIGKAKRWLKRGKGEREKCSVQCFEKRGDDGLKEER